MSAVWLREVGAPHGAKPIEWVLSTSLSIASFEEALLAVGYYERR